MSDERPMKLQVYKLESIYIHIHLDKLVDVPIFHPFRRHRKFVIDRCRSQEWQHIWMAQRFPGHNFLEEPLHMPR